MSGLLQYITKICTCAIPSCLVVDGAAFVVEAVGGSGTRSQEVTEMESGTA